MSPSHAMSPMSCVDEPIMHFDDLPSPECNPHPPEEDGLPGPRTMNDHQVDISDEMDLEPELFQEGEDAVEDDDGNDDDLEGEDGTRDDNNDEGASEDRGAGGNDDEGENDVGDDGDDNEGESLYDEYDINMSDNEIDFDIRQTPRSSYNRLAQSQEMIDTIRDARFEDDMNDAMLS